MHPLKQTLLLALALTLPLAGAKAITFTNNTAIGVGNTTYDGQEITVSGCTLTVDGPHSFASLLLTDGAVLTHSGAPNGESDRRLNLAIAGNLTVDGASRIDVSALGSLVGPGAGVTTGYDGGGGSHGGMGTTSGSGGASGLPYGSITAPTDLGSGGGGAAFYGMPNGAAGGGAIRISVAGVLSVNGTITANGGSTDYRAGAGSGGSVYLTAFRLAGSGSIRADGGNATGASGSAAGGGGRIALYYDNNVFSGTLSAGGGAVGGTAPTRWGGAGTIFTKAAAASHGSLLVDNNEGITNAWTRLKATDFNPVVPFHLDATRGARVYLETPISVGDLLVRSNSQISLNPQQTGFHVTASGNVTIDQGAMVTADSLGYVAGPGAGATTPYDGAGGSYGGIGALSGNAGAGGPAYGSITAPTDPGSGGGGAAWYGMPNGAPGGGALRFTVAGVLTVNGAITANGGNADYRAGAGSGGSIYLTTDTLTGGGRISANGGDATGAYGSAAGGGGRVALHYGHDSFVGTVSACGGGIGGPAATRWGGAGTIYRKTAAASIGTTIIDNRSATNSAVTPLAATFWPAGVLYNLLITNGALVHPQQPLTFDNVAVTAGSQIGHEAGQSGFHLVALGDFYLSSNSVINADGKGYGSLSGPGAGISGPLAGGGGGYGGRGGWTGNADYGKGGGAYGSESAPVDLGSGGGGAAWYGNVGNVGGGAIRLTVGGTLTLDGSVRANGVSSGGREGAGAGGSIYLTAQTLSGSGAILAVGGNGSAPHNSGAGAGGRIALYSDSNSFSGTNSVRSGAPISGEAGSLYQAATPAPAVVRYSPSGTLIAVVDHVDVVFNTVIAGGSLTSADITFLTPTGAIASANLTLASTDGATWRIGFPPQTAPGLYRLTVGADVASLYGVPATEPVTASFTIQEPILAGFVRDTNNVAVASVTVATADGVRSTATDNDGVYALAVPPGFTGNLVASKLGWEFTPSALGFTNVTANASNQNFLAVSVSIPTLPTLTSPTSATGQVRVAFSYQITASNNPTSFGAANLPVGLQLDSASGLLSGVPLVSGSFNVPLSATNAFGSASTNLLLQIAPPIPLAASAVLQPSGGLNDGTDDGSATRGKDRSQWSDPSGSSPVLYLLNSPCNVGLQPAYLQFAANPQPTQDIARAEVQVYCKMFFNGAGWPWTAMPYQISLRRVTASWNELTLPASVAPTPVASRTVTAVGGGTAGFVDFEGWLTFDITALYRDWASGAAANYGVQLAIDTTYCANGNEFWVYSSDHATASLRPKLVVETALQPRLTIATDANNASIGWNTISNAIYQLQTSDALHGWTNRGDPFLGRGGVTNLVVPMNIPTRFFRVGVQ